jgi:hypothetical protein
MDKVQKNNFTRYNAPSIESFKLRLKFSVGEINTSCHLLTLCKIVSFWYEKSYILISLESMNYNGLIWPLLNYAPNCVKIHRVS